MQQADSIQTSQAAEAAGTIRSDALPEISPRRRRRDRGAMLLAVLFLMAMMVIVAMAVAPAFVQQAERDREEEMIHRGTEYARAIRKFYKKFGRYPSNLEQLEDTDQMRFLRRRFKDPLTKDGEWKLLRSTDPQFISAGLMMGTPALQVGAPGVQLGAQAGAPGQGSSTGLTGAATGGAQGGAQLAAQQPGAGDPAQGTTQAGAGASPYIMPNDATGQAGSGSALVADQSGNVSAGQTQGAAGQTGSNNSIFGATGVGGQTFGGGAIVGVASKDKDPTIRIFNKKKTYDEWMFIYSPMMDRVNILLRGPYNGLTVSASQVGTPAGQLNQSNQGASGQQPGATSQQPGGAGQQNPQQNQQPLPGGQFPPDQNQQ